MERCNRIAEMVAAPCFCRACCLARRGNQDAARRAYVESRAERLWRAEQVLESALADMRRRYGQRRRLFARLPKKESE